MSVSRIPKNITYHSTFSRVFGQFIFEVQQENNDTFSTSRSFKDRNYSFNFNGGGVIITEHHANNNNNSNDDEHELIPHKIFEEEIPFLLVQNYSHWWNRRTDIIQFRPKEFVNDEFTKQSGIHYELNIVDGTLKYLKTNQLMVDVASETYQKITKQLTLLDSSNYIHVFIETENVGKVEMVRMRLKFIVQSSTGGTDNEYDILSNEFNGMRVSLDQKYGTLYGLCHGLLLESSDTDENNSSKPSRMFIIPHGDVITKRPYSTIKINVDASELRSPPFYSYHVNETLHQLIPDSGSFSSWFYLAYLHAVTSHGHIEPFTGLTGIERALQILQSACVWSSAPYDEEALKTLKLIHCLAPIRNVRKQTNTVIWPDHISDHVAQDAFRIVVHKLKKDSERLQGLYVPQKENRKPKNNARQSLEQDDPDSESDAFKNAKREYYRMLPLYPNLKLASTFINDKPMIASHHIHEENSENLDVLRTIAIRYYENRSEAPQYFDSKKFLIKDRNHLVGLRIDAGDVDILRLYFLTDISSHWIWLYEMARTQRFSREKFALILSLFAYDKDDAEQPILALQTVANSPNEFRNIKPPNVANYQLKNNSLDREQIEKIVKDCLIDEDTRIGTRFSLVVFARRIERMITEMAGNLIDASIFEDDEYIREDPNAININELVNRINAKLTNLFNVRQLKKFLKAVQVKIRQLATETDENERPLEEWQTPTFPWKNLLEFNIDFNENMCESINQLDDAIMQEASQIYQHQHDERQPIELKRSSSEWWDLFKKVAYPPQSNHLIDTQLYPRIVPSLILPKILRCEHDAQKKHLNNIIGAIAVTIVHEQRRERIDAFEGHKQLKAALDREVANVPHQNWSPHQNAEWLLFEIEQNLTIRCVQTKIANRMINPPEVGTNHSVMQLNMGEGKTAVIVPILAAKLANGQQACMVTVLKSLFTTNLKALRQYLGGMLNRKIYTFPCRRDMPMDEYVERVLNAYQECKDEKGKRKRRDNVLV